MSVNDQTVVGPQPGEAGGPSASLLSGVLPAQNPPASPEPGGPTPHSMSSSSSRPSVVRARQERILELLQTKGACSYKEFQKLLGVSSMTVRRDIDSLAKREALIKTLGGAQYSKVPQFLYETSLSSRIGKNRGEKEAIAARAVEMLQPQQTIYLDGSTTCITFARYIAKTQLALTVITNSAIIAMEVGVSANAKVICVGGEYDPQSASFVGSLAEEASGKFFIDAFFMSTKAFSPTEGTFESSIATLRIKQMVAQRSAKLVLLVDGSKFGQRALCKVLDVASIHTVITDSRCPKAALQALRDAVKEVIVAAPSPRGHG